MRAGRRVIYQGCFFDGDWIGLPGLPAQGRRPHSDSAILLRGPRREVRQHAQPDHVFQLLFYTDALERSRASARAACTSCSAAASTRRSRPEDFAAYAARHPRARSSSATASSRRGAEPATRTRSRRASSATGGTSATQAPPRRRPPVARRQPAPRAGPQARGARGAHAAGARRRCRPTPRSRGWRRSTLDILRAQAGLQLASRGLRAPAVRAARASPRPRPRPAARAVARRRALRLRGRPDLGRRGLEYLFGTLTTRTASRATGRSGRTSEPTRRPRSRRGSTGSRERLERLPGPPVFHYNAYETVALKRLVRATRPASRARRAAPPQGVRRPVRHHATGRPRRHRELRAQGDGGRCRLRAQRGARGRGRLDASLAELARDGDREAAATRSRSTTGRLPQHARAVRVAAATLRPEAEEQFGIELADARAGAAAAAVGPGARAAARTRGAAAAAPRRPAGRRVAGHDRQRARRLAFLLDGLPQPRGQAAVVGATSTGATARPSSSCATRTPRRSATWRSIESRTRAESWQLDAAVTRRRTTSSAPGDRSTIPSPTNGATISSSTRRRGCGRPARQEQGDDAAAGARARGPVQHQRPGRRCVRLRRAHRRARVSTAPEAGLDLLLRRPPGSAPATPPLTDGPVDIARLAQQVRGLDRSALVIQGPPGTGQDVHGRAARAATSCATGLRSASWRRRTRRSTTSCATRRGGRRDRPGLPRLAQEASERRRGQLLERADRTAEARRTSRRVRSCFTPATAWCWASDDASDPSTSSSSTRPGRSRSPTRSPWRRAREASCCSAIRSSSRTSRKARTRIGSGASVLEHMLGDARDDRARPRRASSTSRGACTPTSATSSRGRCTTAGCTPSRLCAASASTRRAVAAPACG